MPRKKTKEEFIKDAIKVHGDKYDYSKVEYKNSKTKVIIICKIHGEFEQSPFGHTRGYGCRKCANISISNSKKLSLEDCKLSAEERDGKCLSEIYINSSTKMKWECKEGHQWETTYRTIKRCWCPECSKRIGGEKRKGNKNRYKKYKITIKYCKDLAKQKNGECLSEEYKSNKKLLWKCENNHTWETRVDRIQSGRWCKECHLLKVKPTIEKFKNYAISKGGECLSKEYIDSKTKLEWICKRNHIWKSNPVTYSWCQECSIIDSYKITIKDCEKFALNNVKILLSWKQKYLYLTEKH